MLNKSMFLFELKQGVGPGFLLGERLQQNVFVGCLMSIHNELQDWPHKSMNVALLSEFLFDC
jgi:hypothetical protein